MALCICDPGSQSDDWEFTARVFAEFLRIDLATPAIEWVKTHAEAYKITADAFFVSLSQTLLKKEEVVSATVLKLTLDSARQEVDSLQKLAPKECVENAERSLKLVQCQSKHRVQSEELLTTLKTTRTDAKNFTVAWGTMGLLNRANVMKKTSVGVRFRDAVRNLHKTCMNEPDYSNKWIDDGFQKRIDEIVNLNEANMASAEGEVDEDAGNDTGVQPKTKKVRESKLKKRKLDTPGVDATKAAKLQHIPPAKQRKTFGSAELKVPKVGEPAIVVGEKAIVGGDEHAIVGKISASASGGVPASESDDNDGALASASGGVPASVIESVPAGVSAHGHDKNDVD